MSASPESFKGIIKKAEAVYIKATTTTQLKDEDGFLHLVKWKDIDAAVNNLAKVEGILETRIGDLKPDSKKRPEYERIYREIIDLKNNLLERQKKH